MSGSDSPNGRATYSGFTIREISYAPGLDQTPHDHPYTSLTLVIGGSIDERAGGREERAEPLSVVVKPLGTVHADRVGPHGARTLQICLDDHFASELAQAGPGLDRWRWLHGGPAALRMMAVLVELRTAASDEASIEAALLDFVGSLSESPRRADRAPPTWLGRVREEIDETCHTGPRVRDLAADAGVHPVFLARAFRTFYGISVTDRLKRGRVRRAARLLADTDTSLSSVAFQAGFADQSHLTRVFKELTGVTPGRYRSYTQAA